jgi:hypothetical protein
MAARDAAETRRLKEAAEGRRATSTALVPARKKQQAEQSRAVISQQEANLRIELNSVVNEYFEKQFQLDEIDVIYLGPAIQRPQKHETAKLIDYYNTMIDDIYDIMDRKVAEWRIIIANIEADLKRELSKRESLDMLDAKDYYIPEPLPPDALPLEAYARKRVLEHRHGIVASHESEEELKQERVRETRVAQIPKLEEELMASSSTSDTSRALTPAQLGAEQSTAYLAALLEARRQQKKEKFNRESETAQKKSDADFEKRYAQALAEARRREKALVRTPKTDAEIKEIGLVKYLNRLGDELNALGSFLGERRYESI